MVDPFNDNVMQVLKQRMYHAAESVGLMLTNKITFRSQVFVIEFYISVLNIISCNCVCATVNIQYIYEHTKIYI